MTSSFLLSRVMYETMIIHFQLLKDNYDDVKKQLDIDLRNLKNWITDNCMIMNEGKCHVMFLSKHDVTYTKEFVTTIYL